MALVHSAEAEAVSLPGRGLDEAQAERLRAEVGDNTIPAAARPSVLGRIVAQLRDPMIILLLGAAGLTIILRDFADCTVIAVVVVLNTAVGVAQEIRAERAVEALSSLAAPVARVVRGGQVRMESAIRLVPGDVVLVEAGDVVPADLAVHSANRLQVDESALTGESVAVDKRSSDATPESSTDATLLAGTVVTRGRASCRVTETGPRSTLGRIASLLTEQAPRPTPLQIRVAELGRVLALAAVILSAVVMASGLLRGRPLSEMVLTAVSLAVAAVPESLPAVVTLALALGAMRMAHQAAVVRHLPAVETLGSVTVLATDKTGTLTEGRMRAERVWLPTRGRPTHGRAQPTSLAVDELATASETGPELEDLLTAVVLCNDAVTAKAQGDMPRLGDPTELALLELAEQNGIDASAVRARFPRVAELPFDSTLKRMTTVHRGEPGGWLVVAKGAPEVMLERPGIVGGAVGEQARQAATDLARNGYRVLAVARGQATSPEPSIAERDLVLIGLVAITDPPRDGAEEVVTQLKSAGVRLVLITGDHPGTARHIADRVGIEHGTGSVLTGADLESGVPHSRLRETSVFARVRPEHKLDIISAWQEQGDVVAMTGDGVNDGPALRRADIGVAMGKGGTEVARQAADLIITDDRLGTVAAAMREGRRIYANVRTFLWYALAGGLAEVLVMLLGPAVGLAVPLVPAQILWINMLTHGLPGVAMGAEPADSGLMQEQPRSPQQFVLGGGLWRRIAWTGVVVALVTLAVGWQASEAGRPWQTMVFLVLGLAQLGIAVALRRRRPAGSGRRLRFLDLAVASAVALQVAAVLVPPLQQLLGTETLSLADWLLVGVIAVIPGMAVGAYRRLR
jgi:P-type Ca2+ transporter type 2C